MILGPNEPSLEQLNFVPEPLVNDMLRLYYASCKTSGLHGHTSKWFMCTVCHQPFTLIHPDCYDSDKFHLHEDWHFLKYAFLWRNTDAYDHDEIHEKRGVLWSSLNILPDWLPARDSLTDFMHAAYLGEVKHVIQDILVGGGMFVKHGHQDKPLEKLEAFLKTVWWPSTIGCLATGGLGKADQWRNFTTVLVVTLYVSWQIDGKILDENVSHLK
ncbi:hypothetical protein A0H81_07736 [Grifola frondosa]|uniref:Uncharacterized protein n=1 Tax=Grifola frondosa TaxID=5627 RepID=A0A1C7M5X2_GRIFR|nr:hypothetical protein A0H81_07736 [Grifola frondosa]